MKLNDYFAALLAGAMSATATSSAKRGLVFVPSNSHPDDNYIWDSETSDLTWYYNYGATPSPAFSNASAFEFVPQLWGAPSAASDTTFLTTVQQLISSGTNISAVLTFNEPDGTSVTGGSQVDPTVAAQVWQRNIEPLKNQHIQLGAPAVTGSPGGFTWLESFFTACAGNCSVDFIPVHWYGNMEGLASHVGQVRGTYPNASIWITEYADNNANLQDSQNFYNSSSEYLDRLDYIDRYSYFGAFRSNVSNVGPNAAMLTQDGKLTDIGSWYLGGSATGNVPQTSLATRAEFAGSGLLLVLAAFWWLA